MPGRANWIRTLVARSSSSGSPGLGREAVRGRSLCTGTPRAGRANIGADELQLFKEAAKHVLALTEKQLAGLVRTGDFVEVKADEQKVS